MNAISLNAIPLKQVRNTQISEKLSKYITACDYFGKILTILSATSGGIPIISFTSVMGVAVRIVSASFSLVFFWLQE